MSNKTLVSRLKKSRKTNEALINSTVKRIEKMEQDLEKLQVNIGKGIDSAKDLISIYESRVSDLDSQIQDAENDND